MDDGGWMMEDGDGEWRMANREHRTENREQRTENTEYRMHAEEGCEVLWGGGQPWLMDRSYYWLERKVRKSEVELPPSFC